MFFFSLDSFDVKNYHNLPEIELTRIIYAFFFQFNRLRKFKDNNTELKIYIARI